MTTRWRHEGLGRHLESTVLFRDGWLVWSLSRSGGTFSSSRPRRKGSSRRGTPRPAPLRLDSGDHNPTLLADRRAFQHSWGSSRFDRLTLFSSRTHGRHGDGRRKRFSGPSGVSGDRISWEAS